MSAILFLCGVEDELCVGHPYATDQLLSRKAHSSRQEAFRCKARSLMAKGYKRLGQHEFLDPDVTKLGRVLVLNRISRFGGELRKGKEGRAMPRERSQGIVF